jgi:VWFA-related protein
MRTPTDNNTGFDMPPGVPSDIGRPPLNRPVTGLDDIWRKSGFRFFCLMFLGLCTASAQMPVFHATTNLQSIPVQVIDKKGNFVSGLKATDFTLFENGHSQRIAFFAAKRQPVSLAILLDCSRSMDFGRKLDRARKLLAPLMAGHDPRDEIFFMPFTHGINAFEHLTPGQRLHPDLLHISRSLSDRGTALYDALASALCRMRTAENRRQAVVVITDGTDQHSRLRLEQLIELARMSTPQLFMVGLFGRTEAQTFHEAGKTVTLVGEHEIDNPVFVFKRLAQESGAEAFFPASEKDLKSALDRISEILEAQYAVAYYPANPDRFREIDVRVNRAGVKVITRHALGGLPSGGPVHFQASTCEVSARDHPYPWELKATAMPDGGLMYREDFSNPRSGWPNREEQIFPYASRWIGEGYTPGGYEISSQTPPSLQSSAQVLDGTIVAYGPSWGDQRASVSLQTGWTWISLPGRGKSSNDFKVSSGNAPGLVFHLNEDGYYAVVLSSSLMTDGAAGQPLRVTEFRLVKTLFTDNGSRRYIELIPWTAIDSAALHRAPPPKAVMEVHTISVEYRDGQITVIVDGRQVASIQDHTLSRGLAGMAVFGEGSAIFRDLTVQDLR